VPEMRLHSALLQSMIVGYFHSKYFHDAVAALPFPGAHFIYTGGDELQYWREFRDRWNGINDLMVVEQDIVIRPEIITAFESCESQWCVYPYSGLTESLGCTRFRKEMQEKVQSSTMPHSLIWLGRISTRNIACAVCTESAVCWQHLDLRVAGALKERGYRPCIHSPDVKHLHLK
jgi:hypothetical protein